MQIFQSGYRRRWHSVHTKIEQVNNKLLHRRYALNTVQTSLTHRPRHKFVSWQNYRPCIISANHQFTCVTNTLAYTHVAGTQTEVHTFHHSSQSPVCICDTHCLIPGSDRITYIFSHVSQLPVCMCEKHICL